MYSTPELSKRGSARLAWVWPLAARGHTVIPPETSITAPLM
jgi:hypothetical protein